MRAGELARSRPTGRREGGRRLHVLMVGCLIAGVVAVAPSTSRAAAPANDAFASAQRITGDSGALWASTLEATTDPCFAVVDHRLRNSIWYRWTAPSSGWLRVVTHGSDFDTKVSVHYGDTPACPNEGRAGGDDSALPDGTVVETTDAKFQVRQGVEYTIGIGGEERGTVLLRWQFIRPPPPPNDRFVNAEEIFGRNGLVVGQNAQATKDTGEPNHAGVSGGASVWYRWRAPFNGRVVFHTNGSQGDRDTVLAVYTGAQIGALTHVAADDDGAGGTSSRVVFQATAGVEYRIAIDTRGGLQTIFDYPELGWHGIWLSWHGGPPPANDKLSAAEILDPGGGLLFAENIGAAAEPGEPGHWDRAGAPNEAWGGASVWYRWVAPVSGEMSVEVGALADTQLLTPAVAVYTGTRVDALTLIGENEGRTIGRVWTNWDGVEGTTYWIAVDAIGEGPGAFSLSWNGRPPNDDFARARALPGNAGQLRDDTDGAASQPGEPAHDGVTAGESIWYSWTPSVSDRAATITVDNNDLTVAIYMGSSVGSLTRVSVTRPNLLTHSFAAQAGTTYRIALDSRLTHAGVRLGWAAGVRESVAPTVTITGPAEGATISGVVRPTATATDASGIAWIEFLVAYGTMPDGPYVSAGTDSTFPFAGARAGDDGAVEVFARAVDRFGNESESRRISLTVDSKPFGFADFFRVTPDPQPDTVSYSWLALPGHSWRCSLDTAPFFDCSPPATFRDLANGYHWLRFSARDEAGRTTYGPHDDLVQIGPDPPLPPIPPRPGATPTPSPTPVPTPADGSVTRQFGANRYATAAAVSAATYPGGNVPVAFVASGLDFPDALAGAAAAGRLGGPLLLVSAGAIPPETASELDRLQPARIVVLGGTAVVSSAVATALDAHTTGSVTRQFGANRYATAAAVSAATYPGGNVPVAFVASGLDFPDALAGAAAAGRLGGPLLLVSAGAIPPETASELDRLQPARIVVLGGTAVVSSAVATALDAYAP